MSSVAPKRKFVVSKKKKGTKKLRRYDVYNRSIASYIPRGVRGTEYRYIQHVLSSGVNGFTPGLVTYNGNIEYVNQAATAQAWTYYGQLGDLPQATTFTALYDEYKINSITVRLMPQVSGPQYDSGNAAPFTSPQGSIATVIDTDDAAAITYSAALQYASCQETPCRSLEQIVRKFTPKILGNAQSTNAVPIRSPWLQTSQSTIPHYGFKVNITNCSVNFAQIWHVSLIYDVSFRYVR